VAEPEDVSPLSKGLAWAARISAIGMTFVLPALAGALIDSRLGSAPLGILIGVFLGFGLGMFQVLGLARKSDRP
jgi:F0F1-type ATP synthase assembly protein I